MLAVASLFLVPVVAFLAFACLFDRGRKKPWAAILFTFLLGAAMIVVAVPAERLAFALLEPSFQPSVTSVLAKNILIIAAAEELVKVIAVIPALRSRDFRFVYDGMIFCVAASLGFATVENFGYLTNFGQSVLVERTLFPVASHALFGVMMGCGLGIMKYWQALGNVKAARVHAVLAVLLPILAHGLYDSALELHIATEPLVLLLLFALVVAALIPVMASKPLRLNTEIPLKR